MRADDEPVANVAAVQRDPWRFQFKRQNTDRGTADESTRSTLRLEYFPAAHLSLLRLDVPLPDADTSYSGKPLDPHLGDIKLRVDLQAVEVVDLPLTAYAELTLPTADPASLGSGKYQIAPALRTRLPAGAYRIDDSKHALTLGGLVQQVVSFAGDESRKDINYTKLEASLTDGWGDGRFVKLTIKPVVDWEQDGKSGATAELEGGLRLAPAWEAALMGGGLLWGSGVPNTYRRRIQFTLAYRF
ncbi:hypothetical protein GCM10025771_17390 [Niveibacterium umoris]